MGFENAYSLLYDAFLNDVDRRADLWLYAYLVDWERASTLRLDNPAYQQASPWKVFLEVGFVPKRVLQIVDPGIRPLVSRMLELPIMTFWSCSGHTPLIDQETAYLVVVFRDPAFGLDFFRIATRVFGESADIDFSAIGVNIDMKNNVPPALIPTLPVEICIQHRLPVRFDWTVITAEALCDVWKQFSYILDHWDRGGLYHPNSADLRVHAVDLEVPGVPMPDEFKRVHYQLTGKRYQRKFRDWLHWFLLRQTHQDHRRK